MKEKERREREETSEEIRNKKGGEKDRIREEMRHRGK